MAEKPRNFQQVFAESLAKGIADYHVSRQQKLDDEVALARQQIIMRDQERERKAALEMKQAQLSEIDTRIKKLRMEMTLTPEQKMRLKAQLDQENAVALANAKKTDEANKEQLQAIRLFRSDMAKFDTEQQDAMNKTKAQGPEFDRAMRTWSQNKLTWEKANPGVPYDVPMPQSQLPYPTRNRETYARQQALLYGLPDRMMNIVAPTGSGEVLSAPTPTTKVRPMPSTWQGTQEQWLDYLRKKGEIQ